MHNDKESWLIASTRLARKYGSIHGELWARHWARLDELSRLAKFFEDMPLEESERFFEENSVHAKSVGERLYAVIRSQGDPSESKDFWKWTVGSNQELTGEQISGFVDGALDEI